MRLPLLSLLAAAGLFPHGEPGAAVSGHGAGPQGVPVRGITISCQTWGWEWGTQGFDTELADLQELGANWVAIHPYARIHADGGVSSRSFDQGQKPDWIEKPIEWARERGMQILVKPHLAYWGTPFSWRGEIDFEDPAKLERFFAEYGGWIEALASVASEADAFAVGTELDRLIEHQDEWRTLISRVRGVTGAKLTYAANWTDFQRVEFWDALDAVGVQGYFPLAEEATPSRAALRAGWTPILAELRRVNETSGKPVVFTELGYNLSLEAARKPWAHSVTRGPERTRARELQVLCYEVSLEVLERERTWLHGAFLWKWFVGEPGYNDQNFLVDTPPIRDVVRAAWGGG